LSSLLNGSSLVTTFYYNNRLQPCRISVKNTGVPTGSCTDPTAGNILDMAYNFGLGSADNGNVVSITNNRDATRSQSFTYDALNRLIGAQTQTDGVTITNANCWGLVFTYDVWGNLTSSLINGPSGCSEPMPVNTPATNANQISGFCYDAAGNLLAQSPPPCPTPTYVYNGENQLVSASPGITYLYDGDGRRVQKTNGKLYWYGMGSDPLDETDSAGNTTNASFNEYVFFNGKRIARRDYLNNVSYYFADHLGTARVVTDASGTILDDSDFYPFGGERPIVSSSGNSYKFTSKERDSESGLDNFGARYDSSSLGRFMSPDPYNAGAFLDGPQTWNAYSYVVNNPLNAIDPNGLDCVYTAGAEGNPNAGSLTVVHGDCINKGGKDDGGVFVDNAENHPVQRSDVVLNDEGTLGLVSYTRTDGLTTGYACVGNCPSDTVRVNAASPDTPTMSADTSGLTPFQRSLLPPPQIPLSFGQRLAIAAGCTLGLDAELMAPMPEPSNGNDKPESKLAEGKYKVPFMRGTRGRPPEMNKSGKNSAEAMNAAAGGAALLGNQQACLQNASGQR
jgi:RHS repeat-associated protein